MHLIRQLGTLLTIIAALCLTACGALSYDSSPASPAPYRPYENLLGWDAYRERCERLNQELALANVAYNPAERMRRGNSQTIEAAVTLRTELPPQEILKTSEVVAKQLLVSCVIEAELRAAEAEFDVQPSGWQSESLLTSSTARWTWFVTPKRGGEHELILALRPVIAVEDKSENPRPLPSVAVDRAIMTGRSTERPVASTQPYRIMVDVSVPADQWVADKFDRTTVLLKSAKGMIVAFTALAGAIIALLAIRRRRAKSSSDGSLG